MGSFFVIIFLHSYYGQRYNVVFWDLTGWSFESVRFPHRIAMTPAKNNCLGYRGATNLLQTCDQFQRNSKKLNHLTCWNQESHQCLSKVGEISNDFGWSPTLFKNQRGETKKRDLFNLDICSELVIKVPWAWSSLDPTQVLNIFFTVSFYIFSGALVFRERERESSCLSSKKLRT